MTHYEITRPLMSADEQLEKWVEGHSIHNKKVLIGDREMQGGECCPDFSCCHPHLLAPKEEREYFRDHPEKRSGMLAQFLARMLRDKGHDVKMGGEGI